MFHVRSLTAVLALLAAFAASLPLTATDADAARSGATSSSSCLPGVLRRRLSQIRARFGSVKVISTFRRGARIAGTGRRSFHASCRAVDFVPPRGKYRAVANWLKQNHFGGVGTYSCGMYHIHIDNGPRVRFHKCGRGGKSRYAKRKRSRSRKAIYRSRKRRVAKRRSVRRASSRSVRARKTTVVKKRKTWTQRFTKNRENLS